VDYVLKHHHLNVDDSTNDSVYQVLTSLSLVEAYLISACRVS
jgi:hypothetical protein